ncbi:MAG: hypothetical protein OEW19_12425, partial [Acidobacteriota bacterium]|nr:hypothetical protein [Acidobacteriota bacterium]
MAPTTISLARLLQLRVAVAWQEAVEVTRLAGALSDASGIPLRLSGTLISSAGGVELAGPVPDAGEPALSMPQLLAVLLEGRSAP